MKKILIVSNFYYPHIGGIEQTAHDCAEALKDLCEIKVICFNDCKEDVNETIDGVEVFKCSANFKLSSQIVSVSFARQIKKLMNYYKPDIVIFNYPNPFAAHFLLRNIKKSSKFVLYWHSDIIKQKILRAVFVYQNFKLLNRADKIIATSPNYIIGSKYLRKYKNKCCVIPSCINTNRLQLSQQEIDEAKEIRGKYIDDILCVSVGRHVEYKGFEYLIKASKLFKSNIKTLLIGEGPLTKKLKLMAKDNPNVIFLGKLSDKKLRIFLYASDIFCFPSITKNEAFGLSLAEAMYLGKPAVTFTIPGSGVNYVNKKNITGLEVNNKDYNQFAYAVNKLSENAKVLSKFSNNAKRRVKSKMLFIQYKKKINKMIESI